MLSTFETKEVPVVSRTEEAGELFVHMAQGSLPAFLIEQAGRSLEQAVEGVSPHLQAINWEVVRHEGDPRMGTTFKRSLPNWHNKGLFVDSGLHFDSIETGMSEQMALHYTKRGRATVSLFEPVKRPGLFTDLIPPSSNPISTNNAIGRSMSNHYQDGMVDDEILKPVEHVASIHRGSLLVFRAQGIYPVAHAFLTTTRTRQSVRVSAAKK